MRTGSGFRTSLVACIPYRQVAALRRTLRVRRTRINIGFAALTMNKALAITSQQFGLLSGCKQLLRQRGELLERSFAHCYYTGGMRRTHLRGHENILKRLLIHVGAFNLSLIFRSLLGSGTPRELRNRESALLLLLLWLFPGPSRLVRPTSSFPRSARFHSWRNYRYLRYQLRHSGKPNSATGC